MWRCDIRSELTVICRDMEGQEKEEEGKRENATPVLHDLEFVTPLRSERCSDTHTIHPSRFVGDKAYCKRREAKEVFVARVCVMKQENSKSFDTSMSYSGMYDHMHCFPCHWSMR